MQPILFLCLRHLSAIGFAPFGIDDQGNTPLDLVGVTNSSERLDGLAISHVYTTASRLRYDSGETGSGWGQYGIDEGEAQRSAGAIDERLRLT